MVNLSDRRTRRLKVCARFIRHGGLCGSLRGSAARRALRPGLRFAAINFRSRASASLRNTTTPEPPATLQDSLSCSVIKVHKILSIPLIASTEFNANGVSGFNFCAGRRRLPQCAALAARLHL